MSWNYFLRWKYIQWFSFSCSNSFSKSKIYIENLKKTKQSSLKKISINDVYEIERLLNKKVTKKIKKQTTSYLIKWKEWKSSHNVWYDEKNFKNAKKHIFIYLNNYDLNIQKNKKNKKFFFFVQLMTLNFVSWNVKLTCSRTTLNFVLRNVKFSREKKTFSFLIVCLKTLNLHNFKCANMRITLRKN